MDRIPFQRSVQLRGAPTPAGRVSFARPAPAARGPGWRTGHSKFWWFLFVMWCVNIFSPQYFIASYGPQAVLKIPTLLAAALLVMILFRKPTNLLTPLLVFAVYTVALVPFAYVRGSALDVAKAVIFYYTITLATLTLVRTARDALPIIVLSLAVQYAVWVLLGVRSGAVAWHPAYFNYDSYGPLMLLGMTGLFYVGMGTRNKRWRYGAWLLAGLCIAGLVVTFARGAVLSAAVVAFWVWVRSPHKMRNAALGTVALVILLISARIYKGAESAVISGKESTDFWTEMMSSFDPTEGTRTDREVLWSLARREFYSHPLFGVGPACFGAYAADNFAPGTVGGQYNDNPRTLWGRALHNTYYELLSEFGIVGLVLFWWMIWDFFRLNRMLRQAPRVVAWAQKSGGQLDLRFLSLALEGSMLAFLLTAYFYNQIFEVQWFYTLITINALLIQVTRPDRGNARQPAPQASWQPAQ
jgi:O-antigen ligase